MDDDGKYDRGQWSKKFLESHNRSFEDDTSIEDAGKTEPPPKLGLHDGPKPPPGAEQAVRSQVRAEDAKRRMEVAAFEKLEKSVYNKEDNETALNNRPEKDDGDHDI